MSAHLTGDELSECVRLTVHGVDHYLHSTTARELANAIEVVLEDYNKKAIAEGVDPV
ncbi:hypothetical protein KRMM14A1259_22110 [Krasilnikovia sp. MM14-A1259]